ncbi:MAG TPA: four helix bundle protein [Anaerolineales bacterium]|nr:four helix bundle protein [Anaerolineales bacterium]
MKDFRSLKVWGKAHGLTLAIYKSTAQFPKQELYSLTNQIQRAAVSVPANIAEGCGKDSDAELKRYFVIAMGSASELEYLLLLAHELDYLQVDNYQALQNDLVETRKMLNSFIQTLKANRRVQS